MQGRSGYCRVVSFRRLVLHIRFDVPCAVAFNYGVSGLVAGGDCRYSGVPRICVSSGTPGLAAVDGDRGLLLTLACRRLWRRGYARAAWVAMAVLAPVTIAASLLAGLLGPVAVLAYAAVISLPVWIAGSFLDCRQ